MPTFRTIAPTETDPEAPQNSDLFKALAENPIAMFEGDVNAPPLLPLAFKGVAAGNVVIDRLTPEGIVTLLAGFTTAGAATGTFIVSYAPLTPVCTVCNTGTLRITGTLSVSGSPGGTSPTFRVFRNGTLVASPVGPGAFSVDVPVTAGDQITFGGSITYSHTSGGGSSNCNVTNLQVRGAELRNWRY